MSDEFVRERLRLLQVYLGKLQALQRHDRDAMERDLELAWAVQHGLQLAIQCVIDICQFLVASRGLGSPPTSPAAVELLLAAGVFAPELAATLVAMIRFRNLLVHLYASVDTGRVCEYLRDSPGDFEAFARSVEAYLAESGQGEGGNSGAAAP